MPDGKTLARRERSTEKPDYEKGVGITFRDDPFRIVYHANEGGVIKVDGRVQRMHSATFGALIAWVERPGEPDDYDSAKILKK